MKNPVIKIYTMIKTLVVNKHDQNITMIKTNLAGRSDWPMCNYLELLFNILLEIIHN